MIIFPEGTRVPTPELIPFKKGVFIMASKAGQPIVPVSISGTRFIQPRGALQVRPGPVRVVISAPIHQGLSAEDLMRSIRPCRQPNPITLWPRPPTITGWITFLGSVRKSAST
jgi:1-acyl-sn-glycerol-3-phosphate acyltransferase